MHDIKEILLTTMDQAREKTARARDRHVANETREEASRRRWTAKMSDDVQALIKSIPAPFEAFAIDMERHIEFRLRISAMRAKELAQMSLGSLYPRPQEMIWHAHIWPTGDFRNGVVFEVQLRGELIECLHSRVKHSPDAAVKQLAEYIGTAIGEAQALIEGYKLRE